MTLRFAFALAAAAFAALGAFAQGTNGVRGVCTPERAEKATIARIAADPAAWLGKCVTVSGLYASERLYADVDAAYGMTRASIGGFVDGKGSVEGFWQADFTGRVSDCAVAEHELQTGLLRSPGISLDGRTLGCVAPEGPFLLFMSVHDFRPAKIVRRLPGAKGGDLAAAPDGWAQRAEVEGIMVEFLTALRADDIEGLTRLVGNDYAADQLVEGPETAISNLKNPADRKLQVFVHGAQTADGFASEACYCLTKDCAKRWPTSRRDADNQPERPYACVRIDSSRKGEAWTYTVDASRDFDGLPEP